MLQLIISGNTYSFRESLRKDGFRWNPSIKAWTRNFKDDDTTINNISTAYNLNGLSISKRVIGNSNEKKYYVKESWIFNLESMHDKIHCLSYDIRDGKIELPFTVAERTINSEDDLWALLDEAGELEWKAKSGPVTGKEYGRIKAITSWRVMARYNACLAAGMDEAKAAVCFEDM